MTIYGVTPRGFVPMRQADCLADLQAAAYAQFGATTQLGPETALGQTLAIMSERYALLWAGLQDGVASGTINGAEGVFVDELLALLGLERLGDKQTTTNPVPDVQTNGLVLPGLVLYGTPGTVVKAKSIIQTATLPTLNFSLDADVTIGQAVNGLQQLVFSQVPTSGSYALSLLAPSGNTLTTPTIAYNAQAQATQVSFAQTPTTGSYVLSVGDQATTPLPYNATALAVQNAIQALVGYSGVGVTATGMNNGYVINWQSGANPYVNVNATKLVFTQAISSGAAQNTPLAPTSGAYQIAFAGQTTSSLLFSASAADVQAAVRQLTGYASVGVSGSASTAFYIHWKDQTPVAVSAVNNTTTRSVLSSQATSLDKPAAVTQSVQACVNFLRDNATGLRPFTDVAVTQPSAQNLSVAFGATTTQSGQPSSAATAQARIAITNSALLGANSLVNLSVAQTSVGQPAQGTGTATCTVDGPSAVPAGTLTVIGSSATGWSGVNNPLDCLPGADVESDTAAFARRRTLLSSRGNGALPALVDKILAVADVTAAIGFQNLTSAALQSLTFSGTPNGPFTLAVGGYTTTQLAQDAQAADVQAALQALPGYALTVVSGSMAYGFIVDFNGSQGGQAQPLLQVLNNQTGVTITPSFGRPPKSFEIVVQGGDDSSIASAILQSGPAGISSYATPILQTTGSCVAGSAQVNLASVLGLKAGHSLSGQGIAAGSIVVSLAGNVVTLSQAALSTYSQVAMVATTTVEVLDDQGNPHLISFSRPQPVLVYINVALVTDYYYTPGQPSSGVNPNATFSPSTLLSIQSDLIAIAQAVPIGGTLIARGTNSLIGSFQDVPGVLDYELTFGLTPGPTTSSNLKLLPEQVLSAQIANVEVSFS